jgi:hypothetical protein
MRKRTLALVLHVVGSVAFLNARNGKVGDGYPSTTPLNKSAVADAGLSQTSMQLKLPARQSTDFNAETAILTNLKTTTGYAPLVKQNVGAATRWIAVILARTPCIWMWQPGCV